MRSTAAVALLACAAGCQLPPKDSQVEPAPPPPAAAPDPVEPDASPPDPMIARVPGGVGFVYLVWAGPCTSRECAVNVSADLGHGHPGEFDRAVTDWSMSSASITHQPLEAGAQSGVGDPLAIPDAVDLAASGEEAGYVGVVARPVRLEGGRNGLLVDAHGGFEHLKRWHELWLYRGERLVKVWEHDEGSGPTWSSVAIVPRRNDTDQLVLFTAFDWRDYPDKPDDFAITGLVWNGRKLVERRPPPVWAAVVEGFATPAAARAESSCLEPGWVLPARWFGATGNVVIARPGLSEDAARRVARESACPGKSVVVRRMK